MKDKGNDGKGNISSRDEWETNQELWDKLNEQYSFQFDCCANANNTKCVYHSNDFINEIGNIVVTAWMNPPFTKAKELFKHFFKVVRYGVAIYRCDNLETKIWQEIILLNATWIFIPNGRISYTPETGNMREGKGTRFPSALIGFNVNPPKNIDGTILFLGTVSYSKC